MRHPEYLQGIHDVMEMVAAHRQKLQDEHFRLPPKMFGGPRRRHHEIMAATTEIMTILREMSDMSKRALRP